MSSGRVVLPHRLSDYFAVVGVASFTPPLSTPPPDYAETPLTPCVVERFPFRDFADVAFPTSLPMFCFPNGVVPQTQPRGASFHSFVMTEENGSRLFGACHTLYETYSSSRVDSHTPTIDVSSVVQQNAVAGVRVEPPSFSLSPVAEDAPVTGSSSEGETPPAMLSNSEGHAFHRTSSNPGIVVPTNTTSASTTITKDEAVLPLPDAGSDSDDAELDMGDLGSALPTGPPAGGATRVHVLERRRSDTPTMFSTSGSSLTDVAPPPPTTWYVPKALVVVSHWPFTATFAAWLGQLHELAAIDPRSVDQHIAHFVNDVPLPHPGTCVRFRCVDDIRVRRPRESDFPLVNLSFKPMFRALTLDRIMMLFAAVLTESRILLVSRQLGLISSVADTVTALLFPLFWQHVYIPVIPETLRHFLEAPLPFIVGMRCSDVSTLEVPPEVMVVDLDHNKVTPASASSVATPAMPPAMAQKMINELQREGVNLYGDKAERTAGEEVDEAFNNTVRGVFLANFIAVFYEYYEYLIQPGPDRAASMEGFDRTAFLRDQPEQYREYLSHVLESQGFSDFVDDQLFEKVKSAEMRFFDEQIALFLRKKDVLASHSVTMNELEERVAHQNELPYTQIHIEDLPLGSPDGFVPINTTASGGGGGSATGDALDRFPRMRPEKMKPPPKDLGSPLSKLDTNSLRRRTVSSPIAVSVMRRATAVQSTHITIRELLITELNSVIKHIIVSTMGSSETPIGRDGQEDAHCKQLCIALENIWCHGLKDRHKPAMQERSTVLWKCVMEIAASLPPDNDVVDGVRKVKELPQIRTAVGHGRAWIRLALERRCLSEWLEAVMDSRAYYASKYEAHAFLRNKEAISVLLTHLMGLKAIELALFTGHYGSGGDDSGGGSSGGGSSGGGSSGGGGSGAGGGGGASGGGNGDDGSSSSSSSHGFSSAHTPPPRGRGDEPRRGLFARFRQRSNQSLSPEQQRPRSMEIDPAQLRRLEEMEKKKKSSVFSMFRKRSKEV